MPMPPLHTSLSQPRSAKFSGVNSLGDRLSHGGRQSGEDTGLALDVGDNVGGNQSERRILTDIEHQPVVWSGRQTSPTDLSQAMPEALQRSENQPFAHLSKAVGESHEQCSNGFAEATSGNSSHPSSTTSVCSGGSGFEVRRVRSSLVSMPTSEMSDWIADHGSEILSSEKGRAAAIRAAAGLGRLDILRWLSSKNVQIAEGGGWAVRAAAKHGHLHILEWLDENGLPPLEGGRWAARAACQSGHVHVIDYLWKHGLSGLFRKGGGLVRGAAQGGHKHILKWFLDNGIEIDEGGSWAIRLAAEGGHFSTLKWFFEQGFSLREHSGSAFRGAAACGSLEILNWLVLNGERATAHGRGIMWAAAESGHLEVLEWLEAQGVPPAVGGGAAVWLASKSGNLPLLKWLQNRGLPPVAGMTGTVVAAVEAGRLDVLEWMFAQGVPDLLEGGRQGACRAAERGYLTILQWLTQRGLSVEVSAAAIAEGSCRAGQLDVLQWLLSSVSDASDLGYISVQTAAAMGRLTVLQLLERHGIYPHSGSWEAVQAAAANGHIQVLQWLFEHGLGRHSDCAIVGAAKGGHTEILDWMLDEELHLQSHLGEVIEEAAAGGHLEVLKWLLDHGANISEGDDGAMRRAAENGHVEVLDWLSNNGLSIKEHWRAVAWAADECGQLEVHRWLQEQKVATKTRRTSISMTWSFSRINTPQSLPQSTKGWACNKWCRSRARQPGGPSLEPGLHWMMANRLDSAEGIYDALQRAATSGRLEVLHWIMEIMGVNEGSRWAIRLSIRSGQFRPLKWLVASGLRLKDFESDAVRWAAEIGNIAALSWFRSQGLNLGGNVVESAASRGRAVCIEAIRRFDLPLATYPHVAQWCLPYLTRITPQMLASYLTVGSDVAERCLDCVLDCVTIRNPIGRAVHRAYVDQEICASTFEYQPPHDMVHSTIATPERHWKHVVFQYGRESPIKIYRISVPGALCLEVLHALVVAPRDEVFGKLAARGILEAAWQINKHWHLLGVFLDIVQLTAVCHLTYESKRTDLDSHMAAGTGSVFGGRDLPLTFWVSLVLLGVSIMVETLQAKIFLWSRRSWRSMYFSFQNAWDWSLYFATGFMLYRIWRRASQEHVLPLISFVGFSCWWHILYSLRGFEAFGMHALPVLGAFREILPFTVILFFYCGAFMHAFYALSEEDITKVFLAFYRLGMIGDIVDTSSLGLQDYEQDDQQRSSWADLQLIWFLLFSFLCTVTLMNIFIGVMSSAYNEQKHGVVTSFLRARAGICLNVMMMSTMFRRRRQKDSQFVWLCHEQLVDGGGHGVAGTQAQEFASALDPRFDALGKQLKQQLQVLADANVGDKVVPGDSHNPSLPRHASSTVMAVASQ